MSLVKLFRVTCMEFRERWLRERNSFPWAWTLFREFLFLAVRNVHWVSVFVWRARRTRRTRKEKKNAARDGNAGYEADYLRVCVFISHFHRDRLEVLAECYEVTSAYESDRIRSRAFLRASRRRFSRGCRAFDTKEIHRNKRRESNWRAKEYGRFFESFVPLLVVEYDWEIFLALSDWLSIRKVLTIYLIKTTGRLFLFHVAYRLNKRTRRKLERDDSSGNSHDR